MSEFSIKSINQYNEVTELERTDYFLLQRGLNFYKLKSENIFGFIEVRRSFSQSEIQNLFSSQITLDDTVGLGANTYIVPAFGAAKLNYNGTAYSSGSSLRIKYEGDRDSDFIFGTGTSFIDASSTVVDRLTIAQSTRTSYQANTGLTVFINDANPTGNGGTIDLYLLLKIITF